MATNAAPQFIPLPPITGQDLAPVPPQFAGQASPVQVASTLGDAVAGLANSPYAMESNYYVDPNTWEKGMMEKGTSAVPSPAPLQQVLQPTAPAQQAAPQAPLQQVLQQPPQANARALSPCELGMCEGLSFSRNANDQNIVASSAPTGRFMVSNGNNLLAQMAGAAYLESRGANVELLEKNNLRTELADLNDMRRRPEWETQYQSLIATGMHPTAAAAQSDRLVGTALGSQFSSIVSRYADPVNQARVQAATNQRVGQLEAAGLLGQIGAGNQSVVDGYTAFAPTSGFVPDGQGGYTTTFDVNGQQVTTDSISGGRIGNVLQGTVAPNAGTETTNALYNAALQSEAAMAAQNNKTAEGQYKANLDALKAQANALGLGSSGRASAAAEPAPIGTPKAFETPPEPLSAKEAQARADDAAASSGQLSVDGSLTPATINRLHPENQAEALEYNAAVQLNPANAMLWSTPAGTQNMLATLRTAIKLGERMAARYKANPKPNEAVMVLQRANDRNLTRFYQIQNEALKRYEAQRTAAAAGLKVGS